MNFYKFREANFHKFIIVILILALVLPYFKVFGQDLTEERRALEAELERLEAEIAKIDEDIQKTETEKKTLQNQIYILKSRIRKLDLQIYQSKIMIEDLSEQMKDTENSILETTAKINESRKHLACNLQLIYEADQKSLIEILLSEKELSDFFDDLMKLEALNAKSQELLKNIEDLKTQLEDQKEALESEKQDLENLVLLQTLQRKESAQAKEEKDYLLRLTEEEYQKKLQTKEEKEKRAAEIRARIFELIGVPKAPTFGEAYEIAKYVSSITGVRPALILAVLEQESDIGKNVGQCYLKNPSTGEGVVAFNGKKVSRVMKPSRDVPYFLQITKELGRDPYNTLVSCPMQYGWGGAMGPAQFIPSTWMLYKDKVSAITGKSADPWDIKDSFLAAALYLADYGATKQTYNSEWAAAMIYFSGTTKRTRYNGYGFYGDSVMRKAERIQGEIEVLERVSG